ncbi:MAG: 1-acyl-sn-glycerol-3-phosphate acyltransferase [Parcubacteria group bacterium Gr01-1014_20]|nr:MAG: 1-acyl-sn-glycerol-3-phosphate acyltransferase [Parcubacteria group bacterium Gr01-1014_20]
MSNRDGEHLKKFEVWLSYLVLSIASLLSFLYFRLLNRTKIVGRKNIPRQSQNILLVSNHRSLHDSLIIGVAGYFPEILIYPSQAPYNLAAKENFFKSWIVGFILKLCRTIPVERKKFSRGFLFSVISLLKRGNVCIFYQATRSFDIAEAKGGASFIISKSNPRPVVVPIYLEGTEKLFGGGPGLKPKLSSYLPRFPWFGRKITVAFGEPINFENILEDEGNPNPNDRISELIVEKISSLASNLHSSTKNPIPV